MYSLYDTFMSWWQTVGPTIAIIFIFGSFVLFLLSLVVPNIWYAWVTWAVGLVLLIFAFIFTFIFAEIGGIIWGLILFILGVTWVFLVVITVMRLWAYYSDNNMRPEEPCNEDCNNGNCDNNCDRPNPVFEPIMRMFDVSEKQAVDNNSISKKRNNRFNSQSAGDSYAN